MHGSIQSWLCQVHWGPKDLVLSLVRTPVSRSRSGGSCFPFQTSPQTLRIRIIIYYHHIYYYLWRLRFLNKFPLLKSTQPLLSPQSNPVIHIPNVSKGFVSLRVTNLISNKRLLFTCQFYINKLESGFLNILKNSMYFISQDVYSLDSWEGRAPGSWWSPPPLPAPPPPRWRPTICTMIGWQGNFKIMIEKIGKKEVKLFMTFHVPPCTPASPGPGGQVPGGRGHSQPWVDDHFHNW